MKSASEMRAHLIEKAGEDEAFRARLIADPNAVVSEEFDIEVPETFKLHVVEDDATNGYLVLPPSPRLIDEQLSSVQGGYHLWL